MHSRIFEIDADIIKDDEWANEHEIADDNFQIDGVDYFDVIESAEERCEHIENFFTEYFPGNSFKIVKNEPGKTAIVRFVGDIDALYQKWMDEIKAKANALTLEEMNRLAVFEVRMACEQPFGLCSKFYMRNWTGCTTDADDFLSYLHYLVEKKKSKRQRIVLYVGQVFDYHY